MIDDPFYEEVIVSLKLGRNVSPGELNRVLKSLDFTLYYDVYAMEVENNEDWQSETYMDIEALICGDGVDAQDTCDELRLVYPLARVSSSYIEKFSDLCQVLKLKLGGDLYLNHVKISRDGILEHMTQCVTNLMEEWGEEPGSRTLAMMIENNYG